MKNMLSFSIKLAVILCGIGTLTLALTGCGTFHPYSATHRSPLPVEAIHKGSGRIISFRAYESADRLYVAGTAKPDPLVRPTHVDIRLLAADGKVVQEVVHKLNCPGHPRAARGLARRYDYVASFPISEARRASKIEIIYHDESHSDG